MLGLNTTLNLIYLNLLTFFWLNFQINIFFKDNLIVYKNGEGGETERDMKA